MSSNTNIGNTPVNQGYVQLIHTGETGGIDGTLRTLYDGDGTASDLQIASNKVKVSTELYIGSKTATEFIQDIVGDMFTTGSYTNITTTYDDTNGNIDLSASGEVTLTGTQTLTNKTLASPTFTGTANGANLTLTGDLTVSGDTIFTNSNNVLIGDAILTLNADETGSPTANAGFEVERGTSANKSFVWNETDDKWTIGSETFVAGTVEANLTGNVTGNVTGSASLNLLKSSNLSDLTNAATARTNLGVAIGSDVQAYDAGLQSISGLTTAADKMIYTTASDTYAVTDLTSTARTLLDDTSIGAMRTTLGLGLLAIRDTVGIEQFLAADIQTSSELVSPGFSDDDDSLMTAAAINDRIESFGYGTGTMSSWTLEGDSGSTTVTNANTVDIAGGTGITTVASLDAGRDTVTINFSAGIDDLSDVTINSGTLANGQILKYSSAESAFVNQDEDTGISFNGSTANGLLTFGNSTTADVESNITFDASSNLNLLSDSGKLRIGADSELEIYHNGTNDIIESGGTAMLFKQGAAEKIKFNSAGNIQFNNSQADINTRFATTGSTNTLFIDGGTDRVGIGVSSPGYKLDVVGTSRTDALIIDGGGTYAAGSIYSDSNWGMLFRAKQASPGQAEFRWANSADSELMRIDTSGNVGIGVFPSQKLHVAGSVRADTAYYVDGNIVINTGGNFEVHDTRAVTPSTDIGLKGVRFDFKQNSTDGLSDGGTYHGVMTFQQWNDSSGGHIHALGFTDNGYVHHRNASIGGTFGNWKKLIQEDDSGNVGIGTASPSNKLEAYGTDAGLVVHYQGNSRGGIHALSTQRIALATTSSADDLVFGYGSSPVTSAGFVERMRIDNGTGNVGIGTGSPNRLLHLQSTGDAIMQITSADGSGAFIDLGDVSDVDGGRIVYDSGSNLLFNTASTERLRIDSSGNVGIGTNSPGYKLDVNGNGRFVADLRCEGRYLSQNGSQSAPSYSFNSQGNAGMFRIGTGIGLSAGGSTIVQVNADGRVNYNSLTGVDHITIRSNGHTNSSSAGTFYVKFCTIVVDNSPSNYNGLSLSGTLYRGDNASGNTIDWSVWFNSALDSAQITHGGYMMSKGAVFIDNIFVQRTAGDGEIDNGSCTYELYYDLSQSWTNNIYNIATEVHYPSEGKYNVTWNSDQSEVTTLPGTQVVNVQTGTFDGTNQTKVPHGSASYPSYSFLGDMNTGIYRQASDTMSFSMGGTEKFRFESDGDFHTAQDVIAYSTTPSDRKLKDNIKDIEYGLDTIMQLSPKEYDWKKDNRHDIGFIAQEVEEVIPEIVKNKEWFDDKIKTLDYEKLTAVLIKAVQEQQDQINELREKLNG